MAPASFMPSGRNEVIVRIISYQDKCPRGVLSGPRLNKPVSFSSLTQLLLTLEELMDQGDFPRRGEEPRSFVKKETPPPASGEPDGRKPLATFQIRILFRQNASWQGTLLWTDREMDAQFRSVLELVRLMDSALQSDVE